MSFLFGGSKSKSENLAYPWLKTSFGGSATSLVGQGQQGFGNYMNTLTGADGGAGVEQYKDSTGYNEIYDEAMRGVTGSAAAKGLLSSGATVRALADRGGQLGQQNFSNYLGQMLEGAKAQFSGGANLASTIGAAGPTSKSSSTGGLVSLLSEPCLKTDIELLGREPDGLGVYRFRYIWSDTPTVGVMADEVEALRPHALGPKINGFRTVNYEALV